MKNKKTKIKTIIHKITNLKLIITSVYLAANSIEEKRIVVV